MLASIIRLILMNIFVPPFVGDVELDSENVKIKFREISIIFLMTFTEGFLRLLNFSERRRRCLFRCWMSNWLQEVEVKIKNL